MAGRDRYDPLQSSASTTASRPGNDSYDPDTGVASASVHYAQSFHLRFAGQSTVRKKRRALGKPEDEDEYSTDEEEDLTTETVLQDAEDEQEEAARTRHMQEARLKLSLHGMCVANYKCMCACIVRAYAPTRVYIFKWKTIAVAKLIDRSILSRISGD